LEENIMKKIVDLLEKDPQLTNAELATMLGISEAEADAQVKELKKKGVIRGHKLIVNRELLGESSITALIEIKVTPKSKLGFDAIAQQIAEFDEVKSLYLMSSSGYDLLVTIEGSTMKEIAYFVAKKLAPIDGVISTSTHFVLTKYKQGGLVYKCDTDERENCN
jgi:DNA-binding Lrp family transcriptional regulator